MEGVTVMASLMWNIWETIHTNMIPPLHIFHRFLPLFVTYQLRHSYLFFQRFFDVPLAKEPRISDAVRQDSKHGGTEDNDSLELSCRRSFSEIPRFRSNACKNLINDQ